MTCDVTLLPIHLTKVDSTLHPSELNDCMCSLDVAGVAHTGGFTVSLNRRGIYNEPTLHETLDGSVAVASRLAHDLPLQRGTHLMDSFVFKAYVKDVDKVSEDQVFSAFTFF